MRTIGITNYGEGINCYPLENSAGMAGVFRDASFVSYDGYTPKLEQITVDQTHVTFTLLMDDGEFAMVTPKSNVANGGKLVLRRNSRYYGVLLFGEQSANIANMAEGSNITVKAKFNASTVRSIPKANGVYSINGLSGDVVIDTGDYITHSANKLNAVSMNSAQKTLQLNSAKLTLCGGNNALYELSVQDNSTSLKDLNTVVDRKYNGIAQNNNELIGTISDGAYQNIYNLVHQPSLPLSRLVAAPTSRLAVTNDGKLYALSGVNMLNYDSTPYATVASASLSQTFRTIYSVGSALYGVKDGNQVYDGVNLYSASSVYHIGYNVPTCTVTLAGGLYSSELTNVYQLPWCEHVVYLDGSLYGFSTVNGDVWVYSINPVDFNQTKIGTLVGSSIPGGLQCVFNSDVKLTIDPITPLLCVNNVLPNGNKLQFVGSSTVSVSTKSNDTVVVSLRVPDATLNVKPTVHYE